MHHSAFFFGEILSSLGDAVVTLWLIVSDMLHKGHMVPDEFGTSVQLLGRVFLH